jgi:L-lactate dehydrogenase complex protein LldG
MMSARDNILSRVRQSLNVPQEDSARKQSVATRLASAPAGVIPDRAKLPHDEQIELFQAMAEKYSATVTRLALITDVPRDVADYLKARNLPASVRLGSDPLLAQAGWDQEKTLEVRLGASDGHDLCAVSHAFGGIAESGTLALVSGEENPTSLNFLPEYHLVVIRADDIAGDMETIFARHRNQFGKGRMPRSLNLITGPSRSADIEQTLLLGAHGPRALHIMIIG